MSASSTGTGWRNSRISQVRPSRPSYVDCKVTASLWRWVIYYACVSSSVNRFHSPSELLRNNVGESIYSTVKSLNKLSYFNFQQKQAKVVSVQLTSTEWLLCTLSYLDIAWVLRTLLWFEIFHLLEPTLVSVVTSVNDSFKPGKIIKYLRLSLHTCVMGEYLSRKYTWNLFFLL